MENHKKEEEIYHLRKSGEKTAVIAEKYGIKASSVNVIYKKLERHYELLNDPMYKKIYETGVDMSMVNRTYNGLRKLGIYTLEELPEDLDSLVENKIYSRNIGVKTVEVIKRVIK